MDNSLRLTGIYRTVPQLVMTNTDGQPMLIGGARALAISVPAVAVPAVRRAGVDGAAQASLLTRVTAAHRPHNPHKRATHREEAAHRVARTRRCWSHTCYVR